MTVFGKHLGDRVVVRLQDPVVIGDFSEPEPDLVLAVPHDTQYSNHHPTPHEVLFMTEVRLSQEFLAGRARPPELPVPCLSYKSM